MLRNVHLDGICAIFGYWAVSILPVFPAPILHPRFEMFEMVHMFAGRERSLTFGLCYLVLVRPLEGQFVNVGESFRRLGAVWAALIGLLLIV